MQKRQAEPSGDLLGPRQKSPYVVSVTFNNFEDIEAAVTNADVHFLRIGSGPSSGGVTRVALDKATLQLGWESGSHITFGGSDPRLCYILIPLPCHGERAWNGQAVDGRQFVFYWPGAEHHGRILGGNRWALISLGAEDFARHLRALKKEELKPTASKRRLIIPTPLATQALRGALERVQHAAMTRPDVLAGEEARRAMEQSLLTEVVRAIRSGQSEWPEGEEPPRRRILGTAAEFLRERLDHPIYIAELCEATGVSERTLRNAFQETYGMSPMRYLNLWRLHRARKALRDADPAQRTVTRIATGLGLWEMGRFAGEYRALFGETPSQTLRVRPARNPEKAGL